MDAAVTIASRCIIWLPQLTLQLSPACFLDGLVVMVF